MTPWNLLPLADRASLLRRWGVASGWGLCVLVGGGFVAWTRTEQVANTKLVKAEIAATQLHLSRLQQEITQLNQRQVQAQLNHEMRQYVQALRQRAQRLNGLHAVASRQWPAALQVQEWRVEGATWRLQGLADSGTDVQEFLKLLAPLGPWQESPALVELTATPVAPGLKPRALRYVMQARWRELGVMPPAMSAPAPTSPQGPRSTPALSIR